MLSSERPGDGQSTWLMTAAAWSALNEEIERLETEVSSRVAGAHVLWVDPLRRVRVLAALRDRAVVVGPSDEAAIGRRVTIRDDDGSVQTYTLVLPGDGEPSQGWIAADSPLGTALLGARPGERVRVVAPAGERWVDVLAVADP